MNSIDQIAVDRLRARLLERAYALRQEIRGTVQRLGEEPYNAMAQEARDMEDDALADLLVDTDLAAVDRGVGEFRAIEAALERMKDGTYGTCLECGKPIALARLEAYPTAALCIDCQSMREHLTGVQTPTL